MKKQDIDVLLSEQLISAQQHSAIIARFGLADTRGKLGGIIGMIGAALVAAGIALLISANWGAIPRLVKVAGVIALLIGAHAGGLWLAARNYAKLASALHVIGSVLFLLAIALIGQVYNISSRPPNAFLLWAIGIAALPWLLKSRAQYLLWMVAVTVWLGAEAAEPGSPFYLDMGYGRELAIMSIGILWFAASGLRLIFTQNFVIAKFARDSEAAGAFFGCFSLLLITGGAQAFPKSFAGFPGAWIAVAGVFLVISALAIFRDSQLSSAVKGVLTAAWLLAALCVLVATVPLEWRQTALENRTWLAKDHYTWVAALVLLGFCLAQIQVGLARGSAALINLGVAFTALNIAAVYLRLFGSMMQTGLMFVVTGIALVALAWALERARRRSMAQLQEGTFNG